MANPTRNTSQPLIAEPYPFAQQHWRIDLLVFHKSFQVIHRKSRVVDFSLNIFQTMDSFVFLLCKLVSRHNFLNMLNTCTSTMEQHFVVFVATLKKKMFCSQPKISLENDAIRIAS